MDQLKLFPLTEQEFKQRSQELAALVQTEEAKAAAAKSFVREVLDVVAELAKEIPAESWAKLPPDLADRLDYYLYGGPATGAG